MHQQSQFRPPTQAFPPIPQSSPQFMAPPRQQSSLEESLKTFMQSTSQAIQEMKSSPHLYSSYFKIGKSSWPVCDPSWREGKRKVS